MSKIVSVTRVINELTSHKQLGGAEEIILANAYYIYCMHHDNQTHMYLVWQLNLNVVSLLRYVSL